MDKMKKISFLAALSFVLFTSCETEKEKENLAEKHISEVRESYAPDKRVALFEVEANENHGKYILQGESNLPEAVADLKRKLDAENIEYSDSIQMLPHDLEGKTQGIIKISVANLRGKAAHSSELVTQATLGMPVKVYKKSNGWYLIQTPDDYLAWVDYGGIEVLSEQDFSNWRSAEKLIFMEAFGFSYENPDVKSPRISDLVAGSILELTGEQKDFYEVKYPHGQKAFIEKKDAQLYKDWIASVEPSEENLIKTSKSLMGVPYLWGGTSSKGVDCSGFTKTIFFLNGIIIPRDASQQIYTGKQVDSLRNFENLIAGDLLFFGRPATDSTSERVVHVGMWIGDNKFIHSMGDVHISNMDAEAEDFDEYNYNRYLRTKRVAGEEHEKLIYLAKDDIYRNKSY